MSTKNTIRGNKTCKHLFGSFENDHRRRKKTEEEASINTKKTAQTSNMLLPCSMKIDKLKNQLTSLSVMEWATMNLGTILLLVSIRYEYLQTAGVVAFFMFCGNRMIATKRNKVFTELISDAKIAIKNGNHYKKK